MRNKDIKLFLPSEPDIRVSDELDIMESVEKIYLPIDANLYWFDASPLYWNHLSCIVDKILI